MYPLFFTNDGKLDPRAFKTFGLNAKDKESAIGFFGTGLKYAIAVLLREGIDIQIRTGDEVYDFITGTSEFRGKAFQSCHYRTKDGQLQDLPFTTELGKNWTVWMAYRELFCNAKDEGGNVSTESTKAETIIIVEGMEFCKVHEERSKYFLEGTTVEALKNIERWNIQSLQGTPGIFYKGIRVLNNAGYTEKPLYMNYNLTGTHTLTEDRTLENNWDLKIALGRFIESNDEKYLRALLNPKAGFAEQELSSVYLSSTPSELWFSLVEERRKNDQPLPLYQLGHYKRLRKIEEEIEEMELSALENQMIFRAQGVVEDIMGIEVSKFPIKKGKIGSDTLGAAHNGTIYIGQRGFDEGTKMVAACLVEEFVHLQDNVSDETYEMQHALHRNYLTAIERIRGEPF